MRGIASRLLKLIVESPGLALATVASVLSAAGAGAMGAAPVVEGGILIAGLALTLFASVWASIKR